MANDTAYSVEDIRNDPWVILHMDVPHDADEDFLYVGYSAAQWCRQSLLDNIDDVAFREGTIRHIIKHSDLALKRMRELHKRMQDMLY